MIHQGPLPRAVHGLIEYLAGALFIAAPFLFGFESGTATAVAIVAGVVIIVVAAITAGPTSLINSVPLAVHIVLDYVLAGVLVAAPFIFGFNDEGAPTAFFIVLGVVHLLVTIATRFRPRAEKPRRATTASARRCGSSPSTAGAPATCATSRRTRGCACGSGAAWASSGCAGSRS